MHPCDVGEFVCDLFQRMRGTSRGSWEGADDGLLINKALSHWYDRINYEEQMDASSGKQPAAASFQKDGSSSSSSTALSKAA